LKREEALKIAILKLGAILLTSIPEELTDEDALEFQNDLLEMVKRTNAKGAVIDITALQIVDSYMARVLNDTARMLKLLGAQAVLCGMNPQVALTLVEMGRELIGVQTALNLEHGVGVLYRLLDSEENL